MIEVSDKQDREKLMEGRNHGMGFAFCKKVSDTAFETVQPISPCKDYLNDVVAAEATNQLASACGLVYKPQKLFTEKEPVYLVLKIVDYQEKNKSNYTTYKIYTDEVRLHETYRKIQGILNDIEGQFGMATTTKIERGKDGYFLCTVPYEWITSTYMLSLYTLVCRTGQYFTPVLRPMDLLTTIPAAEAELWIKAGKALKYLLATKKLPEQKFTLAPGNYHSQGILSLQIPVTE